MLAGVAAVVATGVTSAVQPPQECRDKGQTCNAKKPCCDGLNCCKGHCQEAPCKPCKAGQEVCDGKCTNVKNDEFNCGDCGVVCPAGHVCKNGQCACPGGTTECRGVCVSNRLFQADNDNCGSCGNVCDTRVGLVCQGGECVCPDGVACGGSATCKSPVNTYTTAGICCPGSFEEAKAQVAECCTESAPGAADGFAHCCTPGVDCVLDVFANGCPNGGKGAYGGKVVGCCAGTCQAGDAEASLCADLGEACNSLVPCCDVNQTGIDSYCNDQGVCELRS
jgi:hypothetical protein